MTVERLTFAIATCSWIDPATGLPEVDTVPITGTGSNRGFLTGNSGYRFCNFMEVWAQVDTTARTISSCGFDSASGIYRGPSFLHIPSHAFLVQQDSFTEPTARRFTQVVGARTVSPEVAGAGVGIVGGAIAGGLIGSAVPVIGTAIGAVAGGLIGAFAGEAAGHNLKGFPPIWTKLQIRIHTDGRCEGQLLQHSLFPSMTCYQQHGPSRGATVVRDFDLVPQTAGSSYYNATKDVELPAWQANGWGRLATTVTTGATPGNPWGIEQGAFGLTSSIPN